MKQFFYLIPIFLCITNICAKGSDFAWGSLFGFTTGTIASEMRRYDHPCKPSLYVQPKPRPAVYVVPEPVQPQVVYYPQPQAVTHTETRIIKNEPKCEECAVQNKSLELEILKEQNRKKELALKEKELDIQILRLKQI